VIRFVRRHWEPILLAIFLTYLTAHIIYALARGYLP